jgi:hypothetical protein
MREVFYVPRAGEEEAFRRGWEFSILFGWSMVAVGWWCERFTSERHYRILCGPVCFHFTRYLRRVGTDR